MKNRALVALLVAFVLALPAFAQTSSTSQDQTTASQPAQNTTSTSTDQNAQTGASATGKPLQPPAREGFWGRVNPFARKKYVQRQTQPIRDRLNELDELTASNSKMIKDVDSRAQQGIQLASAKANEADQHAIDAGNKAQMAQQTATQANTRLTTVEQVVGNIDQYKPTNQTEIRFRPGQAVLSKNAKAALDDLALPLKNQRGYIIEVQGFSSGRGQAAIATSQKMADSVVRYLVLNHDIPVYRIYVVGMGNAPVQTANAEEGKTAKRTSGGRVEVSLLKNDLEQLASTNATTAPQR
jgi:outer membrane protein OmpA-like peptidoglycan-associated protein